MKNRDLFQFHSELEQTKKSVYAYLMKARINDFYNQNNIRINALVAKINALQNEFFEFDEKGFPKMGEPELFDGKMQPWPILKEGKNREDHKKAWDKLMNVDVKIG